MLCDEPDEAGLKKALRWRRRLNPLLKKLVPVSMKVKQIFENRNELRGLPGKDKGISLPDEPVIWMSTHLFKDDAAASVVAVKRNAYILFGSLPQFYNTFDGVFSWINGVVLVNRKSKASRSQSTSRAVKTIRAGADLLVFPEGGWNRTPELLLTALWPGIYRIAKETGSKIIPVVHYIEDPTCIDKRNKIHTVVDDPVDITSMSEKEALDYLRDIMATWHYLMMERYGRTTRAELLGSYSAYDDAWIDQLALRDLTVEYYDKEIEQRADYRPNEKDSPSQVWEPVATIEHITSANAAHVAYARNLIDDLKKHDYQRSY